MEEITISKFKATCLAVLERVRRTREPIIVTRHGVAVAEIKPPADVNKGGGWIGSMQGTAEIVGDIAETPATDEDDWEVLKS